MTLDDLATELLHAIISRISDRVDLLSLSLVSRRLHDVTKEFLYSKYICPNHKYTHSYWKIRDLPCQESHTLDNLLRNPRQRQLIREMDLTITTVNQDSQYASLLLLMPEIEKLAITLEPWSKGAPTSKVIGLLQDFGDPSKAPRFANAFSMLQKLELTFGGFYNKTPSPALSTILRIPTLKFLNLEAADLNKEDLLCCPPRTSSIRTLWLRDVQCGDAWDILLSRFTSLEVIHAHILIYDDEDLGFLRAIGNNNNQLQEVWIDNAYMYYSIYEHNLSFRNYAKLWSFQIQVKESILEELHGCLSILDILLPLIPDSLELLEIEFYTGSTADFRDRVAKAIDWGSVVENGPLQDLQWVTYWQYTPRKDDKWEDVLYRRTYFPEYMWFRAGRQALDLWEKEGCKELP